MQHAFRDDPELGTALAGGVAGGFFLFPLPPVTERERRERAQSESSFPFCSSPLEAVGWTASWSWKEFERYIVDTHRFPEIAWPNPSLIPWSQVLSPLLSYAPLMSWRPVSKFRTRVRCIKGLEVWNFLILDKAEVCVIVKMWFESDVYYSIA